MYLIGMKVRNPTASAGAATESYPVGWSMGFRESCENEKKIMEAVYVSPNGQLYYRDPDTGYSSQLKKTFECKKKYVRTQRKSYQFVSMICFMLANSTLLLCL